MRFLRKLFKLWLSYMALVAAGALVAKAKLPVIDDPESDELALVSIFDGTELRSTASAFRGGRIVTAFGGTDLDLRRATVAEHGAHVEILAVYGGVNVTVPDTWLVTATNATIAGGIDTSVPGPDELPEDAPRVTFSTRAIFSGVRIVARPVLKAADESS
jgi:hypothetical protein